MIKRIGKLILAILVLPFALIKGLLLPFWAVALTAFEYIRTGNTEWVDKLVDKSTDNLFWPLNKS